MAEMFPPIRERIRNIGNVQGGCTEQRLVVLLHLARELNLDFTRLPAQLGRILVTPTAGLAFSSPGDIVDIGKL